MVYHARQNKANSGKQEPQSKKNVLTDRSNVNVSVTRPVAQSSSKLNAVARKKIPTALRRVTFAPQEELCIFREVPGIRGRVKVRQVCLQLVLNHLHFVMSSHFLSTEPWVFSS